MEYRCSTYRGANMTTKNSTTMSTLRSDSCHSSYDNLDFTSDYDDFGACLSLLQTIILLLYCYIKVSFLTSLHKQHAFNMKYIFILIPLINLLSDNPLFLSRMFIISLNTNI